MTSSPGRTTAKTAWYTACFAPLATTMSPSEYVRFYRTNRRGKGDDYWGAGGAT